MKNALNYEQLIFLSKNNLILLITNLKLFFIHKY